MSMIKRTSALLGFMLLFGVASAWAQAAVFDLTTTPTFVAKTGMSEVLGQIALTAPAICGTNVDGKCVSVAGTIQILYIGVPIDNSFATGITVCEEIVGVTTCNGAGTYLSGTFTVTNAPQGGTVSFGVKGGVDFAAGDQIQIKGVRGRIALSFANTPFGSAGADIEAQFTASPSTIASTSPVQQVVARSADAMTITVAAASVLQCIDQNTPSVTVDELFTTAFVDHTDLGILNPRPLFGGNANTEVNLVVTGLPLGVTLTWPATSSLDVNTGSVLTLVTQSASGDTATYVFSTPDQGLSDTFLESWTIGAGDAFGDADDIVVTLSGTPADFGMATLQARLYPPAFPSTARPRYADPLHPAPALAFLTVGPCATNILFPFVANVLQFDTGIALVNTSVDPFTPIVAAPTPAQNGTCTVTGFPKGEGAPIAWTTPIISAGDTFPFVLSGGVFAGFEGYLIARCNFQYGHGFAFLVNNFGTGNLPTVGQGYVALIIPDPAILGFRFAGNFTNPAFGTLEEGESLDE